MFEEIAINTLGNNGKRPPMSHYINLRTTVSFLVGVTLPTIGLAGTYFNAIARIQALEAKVVEVRQEIREDREAMKELEKRLIDIAIRFERLVEVSESLRNEIRKDRRSRGQND